MTTKKILNVFTVLIASSILILFLCSCFNSDNNYFRTVGYYCEKEEFQTVYFEFYSDKIEELKSKYGLECEKVVEIVDHIKSYYGGLGGDYITYTIYLYNDVYTIRIGLSNDVEIGYYKIDLYFYGESELDLDKYEKQENLVNFINDFTNSVAFDTKTDINHFEDLYNKAYNSKPGEESRASTYIYHFDDCIGNVGYSVQLYNEYFPYYYKMLRDSSIDIKANHYKFEGLLKSLSTK